MLVAGESFSRYHNLTADEIQTGFGRTGKTFAIEHSGVTPDLMVYAKGFANGMPISGIVSRKEVMASMPAGSLGGTYSGNVVACAAALATTTYMRTHDVLGNVNARSKQVFDGLRAIQADQENGGWMIEEVRGKGVSCDTVLQEECSSHSSWLRLNSRTPTRL